MSEFPEDFEKPQSTTIPPLSRESARIFLEDALGVETAEVDRLMQGGQQQLQERARSGANVQAYTENVVGLMAQANPNLTRGMLETLLTTLNQLTFDVDNYTIDMMAVLGAFHREDDLQLIDRLSALQDDDIAQIRQQWENMLRGSRGPMLQRALEAPQIPETQVNLRIVVNKVATTCGSHSTMVQRGAAIMYKTLEKAWPQLHPSTPETQPPFLQQ